MSMFYDKHLPVILVVYRIVFLLVKRDNKLFAHFNFTKIKAKCKKPRGIYNFAL